MKAVFALAVVLLASLIAAHPAPAGAAAITVLGETTGLSFSAAAPQTEVWIQVKVPPELDPTAIQPRVQSVLFDKKPDPASFPLFTVGAKLAASKGQQPSVVLKIEQIDKLLPGAYTVVVDFSGGSVAVDALTLNIERRAAQLAAAAKQVVEVTKEMPLVDDSVAPGSLFLYAASDSRSSEIRKATVSATPFNRSDGSPTAGKLLPSLPAASASAGNGLEVKFAPADFPIGSATGKVLINSPDLKSPYALEVEVRTKRAPFWLVVTVLVGIAVGFVLRVLLTHRLQLATAQDRGAELLQKVAREVDRTPDETFRSAIDAETEALREAVGSLKVADIDAAVTTLDTKLSEASTALRARLEKSRKDLKTAAELAIIVGALPASMRSALLTLREKTEQALEKVQARDADGADRVLEDAVRSLVGELQSRGIGEHILFVQAGARYGELRPLLDEHRSKEHEAALADIANADGLNAVDSLADVATSRDYLVKWLAAGRRRQSGLSSLAGFIDDGARELLRLAEQGAGSPSASLAEKAGEVLAATQVIVVELRSLLTGEALFTVPELDLARALSAYAGLLAEVRKARLKPPPDAWVAFEQARRDQRYFSALAELPVLTAEEKEAFRDLGGDGRSAAMPTTGPAAAARAPSPATGLAVRDLGARYSQEIRLESPLGLRAFRARTRWQIAAMSGTQTVGVAIILAIASYAVFGERFVGTYAELAGLFFWGFTADLSVAKLTELGGGLTAKPKPA